MAFMTVMCPLTLRLRLQTLPTLPALLYHPKFLLEDTLQRRYLSLLLPEFCSEGSKGCLDVMTSANGRLHVEFLQAISERS